MATTGPGSHSKVEIYDTTLRDGTQGEMVAFTVSEKLQVMTLLDDLGGDFIEGGWPGANPRDSEFFQRAGGHQLHHARLAAFGSTAHPETAIGQDANLKALLDAETEIVTIFGKSWMLHVERALSIDGARNLRLIEDSVAFLVRAGRTVIFDAEHFFDGYRDNPAYAVEVLQAATRGGATRLVLCDTNGGSLPGQITAAVTAVHARVMLPLGIHAHDDSNLATANSLAAVAAGADHVQGTFNGWGERCGNANLCAIVPLLELKLGHRTVGTQRLRQLTPTARRIAELANLPQNQRLAFVGKSAFAHKGGIHVSAVLRDPTTYEHVPPESVGNERRVLVSDLAGKSNLLHKAQAWGVAEAFDAQTLRALTGQIKAMEHRGYELEAAEASLELLLRRSLGQLETAFVPVAFTVQTRFIADGGVDSGTSESTSEARSEAQVTLNRLGQTVVATASDRGPVAALDAALRRALSGCYPEVGGVVLTDYKVRILEGTRGTKAQVRVLVESSNGTRSWTTVGVSDNILEASWEALTEAMQYAIFVLHTPKAVAEAVGAEESKAAE